MNKRWVKILLAIAASATISAGAAYLTGCHRGEGQHQTVVVNSVEISGQESVVDGCELQLSARVNATVVHSEYTGVTWSVENLSGSAVIDGYGVLSALSEGLVTVRATSSYDETKFDEVTVEILPSLLKYKQAACSEIDGVVKFMTQGAAATHSINGQEISSIAESGKTAVNKAEGFDEVDEIYGATIEKMSAVTCDEEVISLRSQAVSELSSYNGGSSSFVVNYLDYRKAYDTAAAAINAAKNGAEISAELARGKAEIDEIPTDKKLATDDLNAFKDTIYSRVDGSGLDGDGKAELKNYVGGAINAAIAEVNSSVSKEKIDETVAAAKEEITLEVDARTKTFDDFKQETVEVSDSYFDGYASEYDDIKSELEAAKIKWADRIYAVQEGENAVSEIIEILSQARAAADELVVGYLKWEYSVKFNDYAEEAISGVLSEQFKGKLKEVLNTHLNLINSSGNKKPEDVRLAYLDAVRSVDGVLKSLETHAFKVEFVNADLNDGKAYYGGNVQKPSDPVTEDKKFVGWYADGEFTSEFDFNNFTVYDDVRVYAKWREKDVTINYICDGETIKTVTAFYDDEPNVDLTVVAYKTALKFGGWCSNVVLTQDFVQPERYSQNQIINLYARFDRYKVNEELALRECWLAEEDDTLQMDAKLFAFDASSYNLKSSSNGEYLNAEKIIWNDGRYRIAEYAANCDLTQGNGRIEFLAKEDITLFVYAGLGDETWSAGGSGAITLGDTRAVFDGQRKMQKLALEMKAGQSVTLTASGEGYLWLFAAEAVLSENFTNARIEYYKHDGNMLDFEKTPFFVDYLSTLKTYEILEGVQIDGEVFKAWSTSDKQFIPFTARNLKAGEVIKLYPYYVADKVLIKFYNMEGGEYSLYDSLEKRPSCETLSLSDTPKPTAEGYAFVGWYLKYGDVYEEYVFGAQLPTENDLELYALFTPKVTVTRPHEIEYNANCLTSYTLAPTTDNGVIKVIGGHEATTSQVWGDGYTSAIYPTGTRDRSISITLKAGETVVIRFAPKNANNHCNAGLLNAASSEIIAEASADTDGDCVCTGGVLSYTATSDTVCELDYNGQRFLVFAITICSTAEDEVSVSGALGTLTKTEGGWDLSCVYFTLAGGDEQIYIDDTDYADEALVIGYDPEAEESQIYILIGGKALVRFFGTVEEK